MTDAPETIWAWAKSQRSFLAYEDKPPSPANPTEYTRTDIAQDKIDELDSALATVSSTIAAMLEDRKVTGQAKIDELKTTLEWYASHVADCRKLGRDGDVARGKLDRDGGSKARAAITGVAS